MEIKWIFNAASSFNKFEIQTYYENEPRFNGVFLRDNLPNKIKVGAYVINLDEYADVGPHWNVLFCRKTETVYFNSFRVEHVPEEIKEFIESKSSKANIFKVQESNSIMHRYFCIEFIDFMLADKIKLRLLLPVCFLLMI